MAGSAAGFRMDVEGLLQFLAKIHGGLDLVVLGIFRDIAIAVFEIEDLLQRAEVLLGRAVAIKAPSHRVRLILIYHFHLVDVAVAALAGNPAVHVCGMIEIDIVRRLVDAHPFDRLPIVFRVRRIHGNVERLQLRAVLLDVLVAVPASISSRHVRVPGNIRERVAVTTIKAELIDVDLVREWDRLVRLIAHYLRLWRRVVIDRSSNTSAYRS